MQHPLDETAQKIARSFRPLCEFAILPPKRPLLGL